MIEGERGRLQGHQTRAGGHVLFRGPDEGASVQLAAESVGRAVNVVLYPGVARREFTGPAGMAVETLVVARTLPLLVWQMEGPAVGAGPAVLQIALPSGIAEVEQTHDEVRVFGEGRCAIVRVSPRPTGLTVAEADGGVRVTVHLGTTGHSTVAVAHGRPNEADAAKRAATHITGHALRAAAGPEDALLVRTGVEAIDDGLSWALARITGLALDRPGARPGLALAALSMGDATEALRAATVLSEEDSGPAALVAARVGSTLGDVRLATECAKRLLSGTDDEASDLTALAAGSLADALQYGATPDVIARLRRLATRPTPTDPSAGQPLPVVGGTGGARRLPMAGVPSEGRGLPTAHGPASGGATRAEWLSSLLAGDPAGPPTVEDVRAARARRSAALFPVDPDRAWSDWRALLDEGLASGPGGPATWDEAVDVVAFDSEAQIERPAATAELLLAFAHGMLGLSPDAVVGRLRLAPRMPGHLNRLEVEGIPIGEGRVGMVFERDGSTLHYRLDPSRIAVPPLLVFEPSVPGTVRSVTVDGSAADLNARAQGARTIVPVQLALDAPRVVTVELE